MKTTLREKLKSGLALSGFTVLVYAAIPGIFGERTVSAQQDMMLARRLDQVEQRFFSLESRLSRLESDTRRPAVVPPILSNNDTEVQLLRTELDGFRVRLGETECGLLRLDERTLTSQARLARKKSSSSGTENCRLNRDVPVYLSARP